MNRMLKVFISANTLSDYVADQSLCPTKEQDDWFAVLKKQDQILLDRDIYAEWDYDDPLFLFSQAATSLDFKKSAIDYNEEIKSNPACLLQNQGMAYLLDITKNDADTIQTSYGVLCQSTQDLSECKLAYVSTDFDIIKDQTKHSWKELFHDGNHMPANTLIILDRYLFCYDGPLACGYPEALENLKKIISAALPDNLLTDFHILLVYSAGSGVNLDNRYSVSDAATQLNSYIQNTLKKPYKIELEFFTINDSSVANFDETHNRKMLSNYYLASTDKSIKVFDANDKAICTQPIYLKYLYSCGLKDRSDVPQIYHNYLLDIIGQLYKDALVPGNSNASGKSKYNLYSSGIAVNRLNNRLIQ